MKHIIYTASDENNYTNNSFYYILWFLPTLWYIIIDKDNLVVLLDSRYIWMKDNIDKDFIKKRLNNHDINIVFEELEGKNYIKSFEKYIKKNEKIIIEKTSSIDFYNNLKNIFNNIKIWIPYFEEIRKIKQEDEIENIKIAINIIDRVFESILDLSNSGEIIWKTEKWLRKYIISKILEFWWDSESFDSIVAFWVNSSVPHHITDETIIWNWPLLIDIWAKYRWYCSDFTRTIWIGEKTQNYDEFIKIYEIVKWAYNKALENIWIECKCKKLDKIARDYIKKAWYWDFFTHSLWHSLGLDIHEKPFLYSKSNDVLKENMFFTIEPWIYIPNKFWIRLENIVHLKDNKGLIYSKSTFIQ